MIWVAGNAAIVEHHQAISLRALRELFHFAAQHRLFGVRQLTVGECAQSNGGNSKCGGRSLKLCCTNGGELGHVVAKARGLAASETQHAHYRAAFRQRRQHGPESERLVVGVRAHGKHRPESKPGQLSANPERAAV